MTTIYITPTHEQLLEFIKEEPLFLEKVKEQSNKVLLEKSANYLQSRLASEAQQAFTKFFESHKAKFFKKESYGYSTSFTSEIESLLQNKVNEFFTKTLEKELMDYLNTESFKSIVTYKIKEKLTQTVLGLLDERINEEAKKIIS